MSTRGNSVDEDQEALMPKCENEAFRSPSRREYRILRNLVPKVSINVPGLLLLLLSHLLFITLGFQYSSSGGTKENPQEWEYYSPVLESINLPFGTKQVDSRLFPNASDPLGIFAAPPSPEVDHAWMHVSKNMIFGVTGEDVARLGKSLERSVKFSPEWEVDSGENLYLGVLDVFHQIHCLNMLRQNLIINYDYYWGDIYGFKPPVFRETHLRHCTSILLQAIMCHSDVGVITHVWSEDTPVPNPDFAINRQCRDFDALVQWRDKTDLKHSSSKFSQYKTPSGVAPEPMTPGIADLISTADEYKDGEYLKELRIKGCNA